MNPNQMHPLSQMIGGASFPPQVLLAIKVIELLNQTALQPVVEVKSQGEFGSVAESSIRQFREMSEVEDRTYTNAMEVVDRFFRDYLTPLAKAEPPKDPKGPSTFMHGSGFPNTWGNPWGGKPGQ